MGEASIFNITILPAIWFGVSTQKFINREFYLYLPFCTFSVELKRKSNANNWFSFDNNFKK